jgi:hypothetical protein
LIDVINDRDFDRPNKTNPPIPINRLALPALTGLL